MLLQYLHLTGWYTMEKFYHIGGLKFHSIPCKSINPTSEWAILEAILFPPNPYRLGRKPTVNLREVCNAIFYLTKTGCQWRYLPKDFPPPSTVSYYQAKWIRNGLWEKANQVLRECCRQQAGRNREPSAGIIDSQKRQGIVGIRGRGKRL
jgi:putative transposase